MSGDFGEGDSVAEVVELADEEVASLVGVGAAGEPVATEVFVVAVVGEVIIAGMSVSPNNTDDVSPLSSTAIEFSLSAVID